MESQQFDAQQEMFALPIGVRYNLGISDGVPGHRNLSKFQPENPSTFTGTSNNVVRIPVSANGQFLDLKNAVLGFKFENKATGGTTAQKTCTFDGSAACIIQRLRILQNGNEIERIDSYGQMHAILDQYAGNYTSLITGCTQSGGPRRLSNTTKTPSTAIAASGNATLADGTNIAAGAIGGSITVVNALGGKGYMQEEADSLQHDTARTYQFGLKNGFFNPSTAKMLPPSVSFTLELTLNSPANCLKYGAGSGTTTAAYHATNFELSIPTVTILDNNAMARLNARLARGISYKCNTFHHHVNTLTAGAGTASIQIGERSRVLKALISVLRPQEDVADQEKFKLAKRTIQPLDHFYYQIGSSQYPMQQVEIVCDTAKPTAGTAAGTRLGLDSDNNQEISEAYNEVLRVFGGLNSNMASCLIGAEPYMQSTLNNGAGLIAVDLQAYSDGSVSSGLDTASNSLPVMLNVQKNNVLSNKILQVDTYSVSEMTVMVDGFGNLMSES
jgi:hypothetical protein